MRFRIPVLLLIAAFALEAGAAETGLIEVRPRIRRSGSTDASVTPAPPAPAPTAIPAPARDTRAVASPPPAAPAPTVRPATPADTRNISTLSVVTLIETPRRSPPPAHTLRFETETTVVPADQPFAIRLRAYDANGFPAADFNEPVSYECLFGVIPVLSSGRWQNGLLHDTVLIRKPGRSVMLVATAGRVSSMMTFEVRPPAADPASWRTLAEEKLALGQFDDAVHYFELASSLKPGGDAEIEKRLARLYLDRGLWREAEEHYRRSLQALFTAP